MLRVHYSWYQQPAPTSPVTCDCGWAGTWEDLDQEPFEQLLQLSCPECDTHTNVLFPTTAEIRDAAAAGNPDALKQLQSVDQQRERRTKHPEASSPTQLPGLPADGPRILRVDHEYPERDPRDPDGPWLVVIAGSQILWRQPAYWEDVDGGERFLRIVWERYGDQIDEVDLSHAALCYICGDRWNQLGRIEAAALGPNAPRPEPTGTRSTSVEQGESALPPSDRDGPPADSTK